jgi:hypothetical protein
MQRFWYWWRLQSARVWHHVDWYIGFNVSDWSDAISTEELHCYSTDTQKINLMYENILYNKEDDDNVTACMYNSDSVLYFLPLVGTFCQTALLTVCRIMNRIQYIVRKSFILQCFVRPLSCLEFNTIHTFFWRKHHGGAQSCVSHKLLYLKLQII